ncbi:MAG: CoA-binding protein [Bacteroidales bacterium]|nr:CoA-binding protein [Bacteroidales bacterium]
MPTVAIVGASSDRRKFGNKAVRAYKQAGYTVYPVHPRETVIEDLPVYRSLADIPAERLDRVAVYLPPSVGLSALDTFTKKPMGLLILNPGADTPDVVARAEQLGLPVVTGCAIIAAGVRPEQFPDA